MSTRLSVVDGRWVDRALSWFYVVVALIALAGQAGAAVTWLGWPLWSALAAVAAVEFGGIALSGYADHRRRLGERALSARVLSAAVAAGAVAVNWFGHHDRMQAGFFAGMSALGYLVWLLHSGARRRDQLRAAGTLPPIPPAYGLAAWLRHPGLTRRARTLALADPTLGLYGSLRAARTAARAEQRHAAIATVLHRKIRAVVDPTTADIAIAVYDLDQIAARLAAAADYDGLTALVGADLHPARLITPDDEADKLQAVEECAVQARETETLRARLAQAETQATRLARTAEQATAKSTTDRAAATKRQPSAAERVAKAIARSPKATDAAIAARLGLSEATVKRHRRHAVDSLSTATTPTAAAPTRRAA